MRAEKLFLLINEIDDRLIMEAEGNDEQPVEVVFEKRFPIKEILALAACAAALVICVYAIIHVRGGITPPPNSRNNSTVNSSVVSTDENSTGSVSISDSSSETSDTSETSDSSSETSETSETSDGSDIESNIPAVSINSEVLWGMGKTFDEVTERYGEVTSGNFNTYFFEGGYGRYVWDYGGGIDNSFADVNENIEYIKTRGGVVMMDNIKANELLIGEFTTLDYDQFADICGITYTDIGEEFSGMYDVWSRSFTHPFYENMTLYMRMEEPGVIDETTTFMVRSDDF